MHSIGYRSESRETARCSVYTIPRTARLERRLRSIYFLFCKNAGSSKRLRMARLPNGAHLPYEASGASPVRYAPLTSRISLGQDPTSSLQYAGELIAAFIKR